jgi:hypothetical protein
MTRAEETKLLAIQWSPQTVEKIVQAVEGIKDGALQEQHYVYTDANHNPPVDVYVLARRAQPDSPRT